MKLNENQTIQEQLDEAKKLLEEKQTAYMHAFASGNLQDISKHRKEVYSLTRQIGQLVKYKLQTGAK
jgi:glycerate kinase